MNELLAVLPVTGINYHRYCNRNQCISDCV